MEYKLPKIFAEKWVIALRSGNYEQSQLMLKDFTKSNYYCCLGVACIIEGIPLNAIKKVNEKIPVVIKGLRPEFTENEHLQIELSSMNDKESSFHQIANWIEQNVEFTT